MIGLGLVAAAMSAPPALAQAAKPVSLELRGIVAVPTFDIDDAANPGPGFGAGIGYQVGPKVRLMADADFAFHPTPTDDVKINTYHLMGKVGFDVVSTEKVTLTLNAGAGVVAFAGDLPESLTYFAINAGAKLGIAVSPGLELLVSPQGDIAFSKTDELGTDNAWVWPLGVGLRFRF
jgi:hypothetical protein